MKKIFKYWREFIFVVILLLSITMKLLSIQFISNTIGPYVYFAICLYAYYFYKYVIRLPKSKHKTVLFVAMPLILFFSRTFYVLFGSFAMALKVMRWYERDTFTKVMKTIYFGIIIIWGLLTAGALVFYGNYQEKTMQYIDYVVSPNGEYVMTIHDRQHTGTSKEFDFILEKVHLDIFRQEDHLILKSKFIKLKTYEWYSDDEVKIGDEIYSIFAEPKVIEK